MTKQRVTEEVVRRALSNPSPGIKKFLTALLEADDYVHQVNVQDSAGLDKAQISHVFAGITKRLRKHTDQAVTGRDICDFHESHGIRLRPDLRRVLGEVVGIENTGIGEPTGPVGSVGVEIFSVKPGVGLVTVEFRLSGLQADERDVFVSIPVRSRGHKIPESVGEACAVFRKKAELLEKALATLDLSRWE